MKNGMNKTMLVGLVFIALMSVLSFASMARADTFQDPYAINGVVTDDAGNVVDGATVEIENLRTEETLTTVTNEYGEYVVALNDMPSGFEDGDEIKVTATLGTDSGSESDEVDTTDFHTQIDVEISEEEDEDEDRGLFLGLSWVWWLVIVIGIIVLVAIIAYAYNKSQGGF